jgi:hypothetical protein
MATISNTPRPGYVWDSADNVWYPIGVGAHQHTNAADTPAVIPNALVDAKGDLLTATADNTPARIAVGANNTVLTADSSTATGLKWATPAGGGSESVAGKNAILNSNFSVWQRGTSLAAVGSTSNYTADRWLGYNSSSAFTISRQATGDTTNLPNIQYCGRIQRNSGATATTYMYLSQSFETVNSIPFAGKTVTYSFYARKGADFSDGTSVLRIGVNSGTGTDQNWLVSYTGDAAVIAGTTLTLTTTWQRFTYTGTVATTAKELTVWFEHRASGTAGANDYYEITGLQLEVAASASAYSPNTSTYQAELAACQYYFNRLAGEATFQQISNGQCWSSTDAMATVNYPIMRIAPTITYSTASFFSLQNATNTEVAITALASYNIRKTSYKPNMTVASGLVAGNATLFQTRSTGTIGTLDLSAEL